MTFLNAGPSAELSLSHLSQKGKKKKKIQLLFESSAQMSLVVQNHL